MWEESPEEEREFWSERHAQGRWRPGNCQLHVGLFTGFLHSDVAVLILSAVLGLSKDIQLQRCLLHPAMGQGWGKSLSDYSTNKALVMDPSAIDKQRKWELQQNSTGLAQQDKHKGLVQPVKRAWRQHNWQCKQSSDLGMQVQIQLSRCSGSSYPLTTYGCIRIDKHA